MMPRRDGYRRRTVINMASAIALFCAIMLDAVIWQWIVAGWAGAPPRPGIHFLDVARGGAALAVFPGGVTVLDGAGADETVVGELAKALPQDESRIDIAVIPYPSKETWGGYASILDHYSIGTFIYNGRNDIADKADWQALVAKIGAKRIPIVTVGAGDRIFCGTGCQIDILSPDDDFVRSAEPRDTAIVLRAALSSSSAVAETGMSAFLPSDAGANVMERVGASGYDLRADILMAPFPALASPSSTFAQAFLRAVAPRVVMLARGTKGTPTAPPKAAAAWLASSTNARVISVPASGTVGIVPQKGGFLLYND